MKQTAERPDQRKTFRDKYLAVVILVLAFFSVSTYGQSDSAKYSAINGYGFKYKRHIADSIQMIPLVSSPHVPYRAGGIKYDPADSTRLLVWTGFQWLQVGDNGTGIDTAYYEDPDLVIVSGNDTFNVSLQDLGAVDSVIVYKHVGTDSVFTKVNTVEAFSFVDNNNFPTSHTFNTATGLFATQRNGLTDISVDLDGRYVETISRRIDSVFTYKNGVETFAFIDSGGATTTITNATATGDTLWNGSALKRIDHDATIIVTPDADKLHFAVDTTRGTGVPTYHYADSLASLIDTTVVDNSGDGENIIFTRNDTLFGKRINVTGDATISTENDSTIVIDVSGGGDPGGSNTQVQYNDGGVFGGDAGMTYNETANKLTVDSITALTANIDTARITKRLLVSTDPTVPIGNIMGEFADASDPNVSIYSLTTSNGIPRLYFRSRFTSLANSTDHLAFISAQGTGSSGGSLFFNTTSTAGTLTERMRIDHLGNVGIGGAIAGSRLLHLNQSDAVTNAVSYAFRLSHITSGTATTGFGTGIEWTAENASGTNVTTGAIDHVFTDATNASEDMDFVFRTIRAGSIAEGFRIKSTGKIILPTSPDSVTTAVGGYLVRDFSTGEIKLAAGGSGTVNVAGGGTGVTSFTTYGLIAGGTTSTGSLQQVSGTGTSGQVLTSAGAGALPTWQNPTVNSDLSSAAIKVGIHVVSDADYTVSSTDYFVIYSSMTADRTLTMPDPATNVNRMLIIKNGGQGSFNINLTESTRENSSTTSTTVAPGFSKGIVSDGTDWWIAWISNG